MTRNQSVEVRRKFCEKCGAFIGGKCYDEIKPLRMPWLGLKRCHGPQLFPLTSLPMQSVEDVPSEANDAAPGTIEVVGEAGDEEVVFEVSLKILNPSRRTLVAAKQAQDEALLGKNMNTEFVARFKDIPNKEFFGRRVAMLYLRAMDLEAVYFHVGAEGRIHILQLNFKPKSGTVKNDGDS